MRYAQWFARNISREARLRVWGATIKAIGNFPLTGSGLGTFMYIFPLYSPEPTDTLYDHAHNDYIEYVLEAGAIGTIFALLLFLTFIRGAFRGGWQGNLGVLKIALLSSLTTIAVHSAFDFNLHIPSNALLCAAISGMLFGISMAGKPHPRST